MDTIQQLAQQALEAQQRLIEAIGKLADEQAQARSGGRKCKLCNHCFANKRPTRNQPERREFAINRRECCGNNYQRKF